MTALDNVCDVCHRAAPAVHVHASSVVPMSFASCVECLQNYAEMEGTFSYLYDYVSNKGEGLIEEIKYFHTWKDGKYMSWPDWVKWRQDPVRVAELDAQHEADMVALDEMVVEVELEESDLIITDAVNENDRGPDQA